MLETIKAELRRFGDTARWSLEGWRAAWETEKSLRQWTLANVISAALAFSLDLTGAERGLILALGLLVLAAELFNSALEEFVDYISTDRHPSLKKIKDCGSAAVALAALAASAAWLSVLIG